MKLICIATAAMLAFSAWAGERSITYGQRIVAAVLMGEACGEGEDGMKAVAEVIRNRAAERSKSPLQVVTQKGAFSCLNRTTPERLYQQHCRSPLFSTALRIAEMIYNSPEDLPGMTGGATFYGRADAKPPWLAEVRRVTIIGQHAFYIAKGSQPSSGGERK